MDYMHHEVKKLVEIPDTVGKKVAMKQFNWDSLDEVQECMYVCGCYN